MELDHRTDRSTFSKVLQAVIRPFKPHLVTPRQTFPAGSPRLSGYNRKIRGGVAVVERRQDDIWLYDMVADEKKDNDGYNNNDDDNNNNNNNNDNNDRAPRERTRMYYIAGGGWQSPPSGQHWKFCSELARQVPGLTVTVVSAPLAPACPAATTLPALRKLVGSVLGQGRGGDEGEQVMLAGDSSGANIVLSLGLEWLAGEEEKVDEDGVGKRRLVGLVIISPAVDLGHLELRGEVQAAARKDAVLTVRSHNKEAAAWAQDVDRAEARISPAAGDVGLLARAGVRLVGVTGGHDLLTPAALGFRDACCGRGVAGAWLHWEGQMHCFPLAFAYGLPEAVRSKEWIVEQVRKITVAA